MENLHTMFQFIKARTWEVPRLCEGQYWFADKLVGKALVSIGTDSVQRWCCFSLGKQNSWISVWWGLSQCWVIQLRKNMIPFLPLGTASAPFMSWSSLLSLLGTNTITSSHFREEKIYFSLHSQVIVCPWGKSVQELKKKPWGTLRGGQFPGLFS